MRKSTLSRPSLPPLIRSLLALLLILLLGFLASGVSLVPAVLVSAILGLQTASGVILWRVVTGDTRVGTSLGMGIALGIAASVTAAVPTALFGLPAWLMLSPNVVVLAMAIAGRFRIRHAALLDNGREQFMSRWGLAAGEVYGYALGALLIAGLMLVSLRNYPLRWVGNWTRYHPDMSFFEALSSSFSGNIAGASIFTPGGDVRYHWLSYAWAGQMAEITAMEPFVALTRLIPIVAMVGTAILVVSWSQNLSSSSWLPSLAVTLLLTGGYVGLAYGGVFNFDSPSQSMGALWLVCFSAIVVRLANAERDAAQWKFFVQAAFVGLLSFVLVGTKVSAAVPGLGGLGLLFLVGVLLRKRWWKAIAVLVIAAVIGAATAYLVFLSGSNGGGGLVIGSLIDRISSQQGMNPVDGLRGVVLGTAIVSVAISARWVGLLWLSVTRGTRMQPITIFGWGLALSALGTLWIFNSFNELWFSSAASAPLSVISALGLAGAFAYLRENSNKRSSLTALVLLVILSALFVYGVVWWLWASGPSGGNVFVPTLRWLGPLAGVFLCLVLGGLIGLKSSGHWAPKPILAGLVIVLTLVAMPGRALGFGTGQVGQLTNGIRTEWFSIGQENLIRGLDTEFVSDWTSTRMAAAARLRDESSVKDVIVTNLTLDAFVPAVTHRQTYVSGIHYQGPYGPPSLEKLLLQRERESWAFIDAPSSATFIPLCKASVDWLWVDPSRTDVRDWEPWATVVDAESDAIIARVNHSQC